MGVKRTIAPLGEFPIGGILMWSGSILTIPIGYQLCDGTNGTPDLRDRFIVGAGLSYAVGATGGTTNHQHNIYITGNLDLGSLFDTPGGGSYEATFQWSGTTDFQDNLPPYYALAYIQRVI